MVKNCSKNDYLTQKTLNQLDRVFTKNSFKFKSVQNTSFVTLLWAKKGLDPMGSSPSLVQLNIGHFCRMQAFVECGKIGLNIRPILVIDS